MTTIVSGAEFDGTANIVIVGGAEFDAQAPAASVVVSWAEFDVLAPRAPVIVSWIDFDTLRPRPVVVSQMYFDTQTPPSVDAVGESQDAVGGGRARRSSFTAAKSSPAPAPTHYHSNAYEQLELAAAAELADEEIVLTFLLELALHD
jgi:hypothetical protein